VKAERVGSAAVAAHSRCSVSRSALPSACARTEARVSSSRADSVSSRPIGTRCTAGGELAGDMPKNRPSSSANGSCSPSPPKDDEMDMALTPSRLCGRRVDRT
jgi:hypothetical protein